MVCTRVWRDPFLVCYWLRVRVCFVYPCSAQTYRSVTRCITHTYPFIHTQLPHICMHAYIPPATCIVQIHHDIAIAMRAHDLRQWLLYVSFAKEPYKRDDILQKRPIIWRSLLIVRLWREDVYMHPCVYTYITLTRRIIHTYLFMHTSCIHAITLHSVHVLHVHMMRASVRVCVYTIHVLHVHMMRASVRVCVYTLHVLHVYVYT